MVVRTVRCGHIDVHEFAIVVEAAHAPARTHIGPEVEAIVRSRIGVVRKPCPPIVRVMASPPCWLCVVKPIQLCGSQQHRIPGKLGITIAGHEVGNAGLRRIRFDESLDELIFSGQIRMPLAVFYSKPALQRGVCSVQHSRSNDLRGTGAHLDRRPGAITPFFIRRFIFREAVRERTDSYELGSVADNRVFGT